MFDFYIAHEYWFAAVQLALAMLGMGATLALSDFTRVATDPRGFSIGIALQLLLVPLIAWALISVSDASPGLAVGLAICAAIPGGSVSNIFTFFARGHIALSIALTSIATLACLVTTPLILDLLIAHHLPEGFTMPAGRIAMEIGLCLLLPLVLGMLYLRLFPKSAPVLSRWCIRGSLFVIGLIVVGALGAGRLDLESFGGDNIIWVVAFIVILSAVSFVLPRVLGANRADVAAINIEVTVRNTNLGLLIKASLFPAAVGVSDPIGDNTLFAILLYGALMLLVSSLMIPAHRRGNPASPA
ncbi:P3 protein [Oceanococcus atlanticus]|uniref:p3 protein n=1 Tax=Oceanococcus atlanticus TaxID=1317117 RepID=A0A1Y1SH83_9GAMM|nr:bile acid:sodium symporter [Oceanococcus atlanticus]ORE89007.1 P3 protein [Oceanococcus atlanticus]RZO82836.1 MAG: bile acid:sodium symporter family protein [Oceanococcus sp.]